MARSITETRAAAIVQMDRFALKAAWEETFGSPPPLFLSLDFMRKALLHDHQCRTSGGLSARTRRALALALRGCAESGVPALASPSTHLVREWNGRTYRVEVIEEGYLMDGRSYRSLTAIAKRITGTNWSGPRFFGLMAKGRG